MPRKVRVELPGARYHITSRGDRRQGIFLDDVDRHDFVKTLAETCQKTGWQVHAYCLMRNHFHLVIETPNPECLAIFATHFYLDPTHQRPIPHPLLSFYMEENGLGGIEEEVVIAAALLLMAALMLLVRRTKVGKAMRATSFDLEAASMMGIDVDRVIAFTFFVGSAFAGAAGVMTGIVFQNVNPYMGFGAGLKAFTGAVVGGIGSITGAMVGGLVIGVAEALTIGYLSSAFQDLIVLSVLIVFMLFRPSGILGSPVLQKV